MRHRLRNLVWRELPFSARRAIVNSVRAVEDLERAIYDFWQNLRYSPAWLFVAVSGTAGIVLTVLLFITLSQELLARAEGRGAAPRIDYAELEPDLPPRWDTRLCLEDEVLASRPYDAEFLFRGKLPPLQARRTRPIPEPEPVAVVTPPKRELPEPVIEPPRLESFVEWLRQPQRPVVRPEILTALSAMADLVERTMSDQPDGWDRGGDRPKAEVEIPVAYAGDPELNTAAVEEDDVWSDPTAYGNQADVALRVQLHAPQHAGVGQAGHSEIIVRNDGKDALRRVLVTEPTVLLPFVTGAHPSARLQGGLLEREFRRLRPGRERSAGLDWFAREPGVRQHEVIVLAEAVVAATVQVEAGEKEVPLEAEIAPEVAPRERPPRVVEPDEEIPTTRPPEPRQPEPAPAPIVETVPEPTPEPKPVVAPPRPRAAHPAVACKVKAAPAAKVNDVVELKLEVQNTGETRLSDVRIWADVPGSLKHKHGSQLELAVGSLEPGQVHHAVLRVVGQQAGAATATFRVVSKENIKANAIGKVAIVAPAVAKAAPVKKPVKPRVTTPTCPCECEAASTGVIWAGYEF